MTDTEFAALCDDLVSMRPVRIIKAADAVEAISTGRLTVAEIGQLRDLATAARTLIERRLDTPRAFHATLYNASGSACQEPVSEGIRG